MSIWNYRNRCNNQTHSLQILKCSHDLFIIIMDIGYKLQCRRAVTFQRVNAMTTRTTRHEIIFTFIVKVIGSNKELLMTLHAAVNME